MVNFLKTLFTRKLYLHEIVPRIPYRNDSIFGLLFLLAFSLPLLFIPVIGEGFETPKFAYLLVLLGVISIVALFSGRHYLKFPKLFFYSGLFFLVWLVLSTIFSADIRNSLFGLIGRSANSTVAMFGFAFLVSILYSFVDRIKFQTVVTAMVVSGSLIALYSLLQHEGIGFYAGLDAGSRQFIPSFLGNPNFNSMFLAQMVPLSLFLFFRTTHKVWKWTHLALTFLSIWAIVQTTSRAAIFGLIVALVFLGIATLIKFRNKKIALVIIGIAIISAVLSYFALQIYRPNSIVETAQLREVTQEYRFAVWDMTIGAIKDHPFVGTGFSNFHLLFKQAGWSVFSAGERFDDPHNIFFTLTTSGGIPLVVSFLFLLGIAIYYGWEKSKEDGLSLFLIASIFAWIVAGSFGPVVIACWVLLAFVLGGLLIVNKDSKFVFYSQYTTRGLAGFGILLLVAGLVSMSSHIAAHIAQKKYESGDFQKAAQIAKIAQVWDVSNSLANVYYLKARVKGGMDYQETSKLVQESLDRRSSSSAAFMSAATLNYMMWSKTQDQNFLVNMQANIDRAIQLEPNFSGLYAQAAYMYFKSGQIDKALLYEKLALTYNSDQFYGWVLLAKLYYDTNNRPQFLYAYDRAYRQNIDSLLMKGSFATFKETKNIQEVPFPVYFPDVE